MTWYSLRKPQTGDARDQEGNISVPAINASTRTEVLTGQQTYNAKEFVCGWGSAFINITLTFPIYKLIFRQMLHGVKLHNAFQQLQHEGVFYLYRGMLPPLCQKTMSLSIMFGVYEGCRKSLVENNVPTILAKSFAAMVAGSIEGILIPFERIQTLLQDRHYHKYFKNSTHAFRIIGWKYGITEYYRGLTPILLRNGPSNVMFFILRDEVKDYFSESDSTNGQFMQEFISGAVIGAFISTVFYPMNVLKVRMQSRLGGPFQNCWTVFVKLYKRRGFRNMYSGVHLNYTRAFLSWGIINASYEFLVRIF